MRRVLDRIRAVADPHAIVEPYGSSVYAPAHASDVDVLVLYDDPDRLAAALGLTRIPTAPPRMYGELEGSKVDITVVNAADHRMRSGPRDAALLAAFLEPDDAAFQAAWPHVRQFVRLRALGHNGLGWFGSFGWALLFGIPLVTELKAEPGTAFPAWLRWGARLAPASRISLDGVSLNSDFFLVAPSPPLRDVAKINRRAANVLVEELRGAARAIGTAQTDEEAIARIVDLADDPPKGEILVISGTEEHTRGRYDGSARGLLRELEPLGPIRSWGRFDLDDSGWEHRITVPSPRIAAARDVARRWLAHTNIDAFVD